jgi:hypothetical protein
VTARIAVLLKVVLLIIVVLAPRDGLTPGDVPLSSTGVDQEREAQQVSTLPTTPISMRDDDVEDPVDLYGNEVTAAVAKYKLDSTGSLYELHSPETELPRLPAPKS